MRKFFKILLLLFFLFAFSKQTLAADEKQDSFAKKTALGVNPAIVEVVVDKKPVIKELTLYNLTNFPLPIKTLKSSFSPKEKLEIPKEKLQMFDASSWIKLSSKDEDFILQPKEARKIKLEINAAPGATPGGHYASLVFQPMIPEEIVSKESVFVFARVSALLFIQKAGDIVENLSIKKFETAPFYQKLPIEIKLRLKNSGNTHIRPSGQVAVYDEFTKKIVVTLSTPQTIILPGTEKDFNVVLNEDNSKNLKMGRYFARAEISYGTESLILKTEKKYFIVFPSLSIFLGALFLLVFLIIIVLLRNRLSKALIVIFLGEERLKKHLAKEKR